MTERTRPVVMVALLALVAALLAAVPLASPADAESGAQAALLQDTGTDTRVAGDDAVGTAIALALASYDTGSDTPVDTVVLSRVDDYADALTGAPLAAANDAPMLFTDSDALSDGVLDAIQALGASNVIILGGVDAVSAAVEQELTSEGLATTRVGGSNRFETAALIAADLTGGATPDTVFFVEGENADDTRGWPDAINIAAAAAATGQVIIPVNAEYVPPESQALWDSYNVDPETAPTAWVIGGTEAVTDTVSDTLAGPDAEDPLPRLAGLNRFETSAATYAYSVSEALMDPAHQLIIPGNSFVEGLAAGAIGGQTNMPMVMVDSVDPANSPSTIDLLGSALDINESYTLVGNTDAISDDVATAILAAKNPAPVTADTCLTLLHHNDGESQLLGTGPDNNFGALSRLVTLAGEQQDAATNAGCAPVTVTSGDNFLAGPELTASDPLNGTDRVLDTIGLSEVGYDALAIGNHDTDFGPDFLARFVGDFDPAVPFLSANLDVSAVPSLQALADDDRIAPSVVVDAGGTDVAIIGLTTPTLRSISSPGDIVVEQEIVDIVQTEIDSATDSGVDHVVLISHLQGVNADADLVGQLSGLDVVVAGGGDEVLSEPADPLVPGDLGDVFDAYPLLLTDADGDTVPAVTTAGDYKYLGRLTLYFDADGNLLPDTPFEDSTSRMLRIADESLPGGVERDPFVVTEVEEPVEEFVAYLDSNVIATSEVGLDGSRPAIRDDETNLGNLVADAHAFTAEAQAADFGLDETATFVGFQNGGGIRNNSVIEAGDITELDTFDILPFSNFIGVVEDFTVADFKDVLEQGYSAVEFASGAFIHVSDNVEVEIDLDATAQVVEVDDTGQVTITTPGERVRTLTIDGTEVVTDGVVVDDTFTFSLTTADFSLRNGDAYPFNLADDEFTIVGQSYQQSLAGYLQAPAADGGLEGTISAADYPAGGEGRLTITGGDS